MSEEAKGSHNGGHGNHEHSSHHDHTEHHRHMIADFRRRFWISLILTIPVLALAPVIQGFLGLKDALQFAGESYVQFAFSAIIFFYGGFPFLKGLLDELKKKQPGMMTLISLAIIVAFVYSSAVVFGLKGRTFFWELATLIDVMLLGHWIEMRSVVGASKALDELAKLLPSEAHRLKEDGSTEDVPVSDLNSGDSILIKPGEKIPADGKITEGSSSVNEAMITGESNPVSKSEGDDVIGGAVNGEGALTVAIEKTGDESYLSQVMNMVREAQASKSRTQNLADRAALWLTIIAISVGAITLVIWHLFVGRDFIFALTRSVTVMVITCPHALGLAIPLVVAVSTALSARNGLLIRNRGPFETARNIDAIIFDKTGTLTKGKFEVSDTLLIGEDMDEKKLIRYAAAVESRSEHPIARAIAAEADPDMKVESFEAIKGKGAKASVDGTEVLVVSRAYLDENDIRIDEGAEDFQSQGKTVAFVVVEGRAAGAIALSDPVREESKEAIAMLKDMGVRTLMLTGDNRHVAQSVAEELGLSDYFAEVLPDKKADKVKEVQSEGSIVAMVGDGINDAPALAQADVGIAIGAGTDVAIESADIVLVKNNPLDVVRLLAYAKATYRKMVQNIFWATGYNVVAIPLAAGVLSGYGIVLSPAVGALLMSLSTVIVAVNARFLRVPESGTRSD